MYLSSMKNGPILLGPLTGFDECPEHRADLPYGVQVGRAPLRQSLVPQGSQVAVLTGGLPRDRDFKPLQNCSPVEHDTNTTPTRHQHSTLRCVATLALFAHSDSAYETRPTPPRENAINGSTSTNFGRGMSEADDHASSARHKKPGLPLRSSAHSSTTTSEL